MNKIVYLLLLFSICFKTSFSVDTILAKSIFKPNLKESKIRTAVENLIYIKVLLDNKSTTDDKYKDFFSEKLNRHSHLLQNSLEKLDKSTIDDILIRNKSKSKNVELNLLSFIKNSGSIIDTKNLPELDKEDPSYKFYLAYYGEQFRLYKLFDKYPSEIKSIDESEILGDKFTSGKVYLTLDDGPSKHTPNILNILEENNANATFFLLGNSIRKDLNNNLKLINKMIENGNQVGVHSETHKNLIKIQSESELQKEIVGVKNLLNEKLDFNSKIFRAPYGSRNKANIEMIKANYESHILWNIDSQDWRKNFTPEIITERIIRLVNLNNGGIVLFHGTKIKAEKCFPRIITELKASGYKFSVFS